MCKHCRNVENIHYAMQVHKATISGQPEESIMSRDNFNDMDDVAPEYARRFVNQARRKDIDIELVSGFSFAMEQNAIGYYYYFEKPKDMQVQLDLVKDIEALRAALSLVQARLVLTDNDSLKSVIDDALSKHNPKINSNDLAKELKQITLKASQAKAKDIDE